ncbi:hypothetical protein C8C99_3776 [Acidovorax sp. 107]|nr:hypothetical protein C8C99_3776 [Acidovorax sp. 107]
MDGTVNWANREEGRVVRTGTCEPACSAGAAAGAATAAGGAVTLGAAAVLAVAFAATLDAAGAAALFAAAGVTLVAPLGLLVSAFTSWSPRSTGGPLAALTARDWWQALGGFTGARLYRPELTQTETLQIQHKSGSIAPQNRQADQTRLCSSPCRKMSLGRSMPMNTILLVRGSPSAHWGPRSLPMSWCTPWKITLRSVPFIFSTPL